MCVCVCVSIGVSGRPVTCGVVHYRTCGVDDHQQRVKTTHTVCVCVCLCIQRPQPTVCVYGYVSVFACVYVGGILITHSVWFDQDPQ